MSYEECDRKDCEDCGWDNGRPLLLTSSAAKSDFTVIRASSSRRDCREKERDIDVLSMHHGFIHLDQCMSNLTYTNYIDLKRTISSSGGHMIV